MLWLEYIMSAIAPHLCVRCGREGALLCDVCAPLLPSPAHYCYRCNGNAKVHANVCANCRPQTPLSTVYAPTIYDGIAQQLVHKLKFERARAAADAIAVQIAPLVPQSHFDLIAHAPTANTRARKRGYDQSALIARRISQLTDIPYAPLLWRTGKQRQLGQSRSVRRKQLKMSFAVHAPDRIKHSRVLVIDDVLTTGSTLEAAAEALVLAGASRVGAAVFALVPRS